MSEIIVEPMRPEFIESFHDALDSVSRERRYLSFLEAPPLERLRTFVLEMIESGYQFVALDGSKVVGWCDIRPNTREAHAHRGALGMGIINGYREQGLGRRLIIATLDAAQSRAYIALNLMPMLTIFMLFASMRRLDSCAKVCHEMLY